MHIHLSVCIYMLEWTHFITTTMFLTSHDSFRLVRDMLLFHLPLEWIFAVCNVTCPFYIMPVLNGSSRQICLIKFVWNGRNQYNWEIFSKCLSHNCDIYSVMLNCYWSLSPLVRERRPPSRMLSDLVLKLKLQVLHM